MAADARDREALDLVGLRTFVDCALVSLDLDMQTRRLTLRVYGALWSDNASTVLATLTFFGTDAIATGGIAGAFPASARLVALDVVYPDEDDSGTVAIRGRAGWTIGFSFDGLAYEEHPAVLASLVDDDS